MKGFIKTVAFAILICSCNSSNQSNNSDVPAGESETAQPTIHEEPIQDSGYMYWVVTSDLIQDLGGYDALRNYQFYLSESFTLTRYDNEKNSTGEGNVSSVSGKYRVHFNSETPGVYKRGTSFVEIYFGEEDDEYLIFDFEIDGTYYLDRNYQKRATVYYKGEYWTLDSSASSDINLLVRIEPQSFEQEEVAKGRLLR